MASCLPSSSSRFAVVEKKGEREGKGGRWGVIRPLRQGNRLAGCY